MNAPRLLLGLTLALALAAAGELQAQGRRRPAAQPQTNAEHERLKTEADQAYQRGEYERTVDLSSQVLQQNPADDVSLYLRGSARVEIGLRQNDAKLVRDGVADAREAIRVGGSTEKINYYLPYLYGMTRLSAIEGRRDHAQVALTVADQVLNLPSLKDEDKANILYQRGAANMQLQQFADAAADFEKALQASSEHLGALMGAADAYAAAGRSQQALQMYDRAVRANSDNPLVYNNRGMYLQRQQRWQDAIADFTRALELDPRYFYALTNRGFALLESGNAQAAETDFTASLRANPDQPTVYSLRGAARLAQGRIQEALQDYSRVLEQTPGNAVAMADIGFARFFSGDYSGALQSFEQAMRQDASLRYLAPWRFLAMELTGRGDAARQQFAEQIDRAPAQRDWTDSLVAYLAGSLSADELLRQAQAADRQMQSAQSCEAHFFIAQRELQAGNAQAAREHLQKAVQTRATHLSAYRGAQLALRGANS
jgi:tetratricopeptide (TPR) repeat protein